MNCRATDYSKTQLKLVICLKQIYKPNLTRIPSLNQKIMLFFNVCLPGYETGMKR